MIAPLAPDAYRDLVRRALEEDLGRGDATSRATIDEARRARGTIVAKSPLVVAGLDVAREVFHQTDPASVVEVRWGDGAHVQAGDVVAFVTGNARALLAAERTALNFLQRLSGIATLTARCVAAAAGRITVLDTRKTTPTLRALEKYAVRCGGGTNHRQRLDEALLIKDNHKRLAGGIQQAVRRAQAHQSALSLEVEVETLEELDPVLELRVSRASSWTTSRLPTFEKRCADRRSRRSRDFRWRDGRAHCRARHHRGAVRVHRRADTFRSRRGSQLRVGAAVTGLPEDIASALDVLARRRPDVALDVRWLPTVGSTMDAVANLASRGAPDGVVVGADEQIDGAWPSWSHVAVATRRGPVLFVALPAVARGLGAAADHAGRRCWRPSRHQAGDWAVDRSQMAQRSSW